MDQAAIKNVEAPGRVRCEFYFDEDHNCDMAKIWIIGDTGNLLKRAGPEVISRWPAEWELYQKTSGGGKDPVGGTPLKEVPGLERDSISVLRYNGVRNVEEFIALSEDDVRRIGAGFNVFWRAAINMMKAKKADEQERRLAELEARLAEAEKPKRGPGRPRKDETDQLEAEA